MEPPDRILLSVTVTHPLVIHIDVFYHKMFPCPPGEDLRNNFTRVVMVVWLFVVFVVTASYTASLTSMLTVQRLEPTITDIETLKRSNSPVGCELNSFVGKYVEHVLGFYPNNIIDVRSEFEYLDKFKSEKIKAALLELPYERVFISRYGKAYQVTDGAHRFGGLGFSELEMLLSRCGSNSKGSTQTTVINTDHRSIYQHRAFRARDAAFKVG
ncbi:hypothetical protein IFM89_002428 [Coptis chinensis]|uniref:Ionotropic glutamate receptor C-terminal domain-containing protein n=1 Tax=Coptis chinensis TaxID=261450 RepID=A0A835INB9_9MAGN|nr:hypothetical protein IFM89_002428 [Coptis chinensis]